MPQRKKLSRSKAKQLDVREIVSEIEQPKAPLALRLSALLMRGVVHLYSTQVKYLEIDSRDFAHRFQTSLDERDTSKKRKRKRAKASEDADGDAVDDGDEPFVKAAATSEHQAKREHITNVRVTMEPGGLPELLGGTSVRGMPFNASDSFAMIDSQAFTTRSSPSDSHQRARARSGSDGFDTGAGFPLGSGGSGGPGSSSGEEEQLPPVTEHLADEIMPELPAPPGPPEEDPIPPPPAPPPAEDDEKQLAGAASEQQQHGEEEEQEEQQQQLVSSQGKISSKRNKQPFGQKQQRRKKAGLATDSEIQVNDTTYQEWLKSETELTITRATKQAQATPIKELMQQPLLVNNAGEEIGMELNVQEPASRNRSNESSRHASSRASPAQQQHQQQEAEENAEEDALPPPPPPHEEPPERMRGQQSTSSSQNRSAHVSPGDGGQPGSGSSDQLGFASSGGSSEEKRPTGPLADVLFAIENAPPEAGLPRLEEAGVASRPRQAASLRETQENAEGLAEESEPRTQRISQLAFREDSKTAAVRNFLQREFDSEQADSSSLSLASLINQHRLGRLGGASLFFHVLALASMQSIDVEQHEPYADIMLTLCRENTTA